MQSRGKFLATGFFLSFFSFVTVAFGNFVILWVDPARETVEAFTIDDYSQLICFWSGLFYWGLCAWYGARLMLERSFAPFDYILPCVSKGFAAQVIKWTPRALGLLAVIPIALLFLFDPRMQDTWFGLRVVPLGIGTLLLGFFVFRKKLFGEFVVPLSEQETDYGYQRFGKPHQARSHVGGNTFRRVGDDTSRAIGRRHRCRTLDWRTGDSAICAGLVGTIWRIHSALSSNVVWVARLDTDPVSARRTVFIVE